MMPHRQAPPDRAGRSTARRDRFAEPAAAPPAEPGSGPLRGRASAGQSLPQRIVADIHQRITSGVLAPGDRLPSSRRLAAELGVSRGSVVSAYEQLVGEGYLMATHGGTRVDPALPRRVPHAAPGAPATAPAPAPAPLRPGSPDVSEVTSGLWRATWRAAAADPRPHPPQGSEELRALLAEHVRLTRRVTIDPRRILVTAGARDGLRLVLSAMRATGTIGVENPGYPSLRAIPRLLGWRMRPLARDADGALPESLEGVEAALLTPNHQFPAGGRMPAVRRHALLAAASSSGTLLIEDDFDADLHEAPAPLLASGTDGPVALLGSFSASLTPALGLGWVVVPEGLVDDVAQRCVPVSGIVQDAMTRYLRQDGLRRHAARARRLDRKRREVFLSVFPAGTPMEGGLHAVVPLTPGTDEAAAVARARTAGLGVEGLASYWSVEGRGGWPGIVLGLGSRSPERLRELLDVLREALGPGNIVG
ncbi:PLP-dependent aminotransferase family protein [Actinomyces gaoshouyii]|uniref:MocR-like pyridoxine biosynthesis transcription factor PdxR n=1 Tax=Actinomyces gaoshouyii TaxID=1960083 RepID=UPI0009BED2CD|nr:PLP-dependent aminotransferase family protein [Actinomyces gaoshouyii]ARD41733.1 GntR family transcriptional regulator [Actinomyces gaoshouyii]